jgi:peptidoglycan/LPS O-acetylase OafA/YrhL
MNLSQSDHHVRSSRNFDWLRLLFATFVIFSHSFGLLGLLDPIQRTFGTTSFGNVGLMGFFLISGYLITQSWMSDPSIGRFLTRRVLRLYPAFIIASLVSVFMVGPLGADVRSYFHELDIGRSLSYLLLLHDPQTPPVFAGSVERAVNGAMWTISFEFRCYLLIILLACLQVFRNRFVLLAIALIFGVTACITVPVSGPMDAQHALFGIRSVRISDFMLWFGSLFLSGSCFYVFRERIPYTRIGLLIALVVLLGSMLHPDTLRPGMLLAGAYVVFGIGSGPALFGASKAPTADRSYGLYLYGWPIQKLVSWHVPHIAPWVLFIATMGIGWCVATLSWRFVEAPALRFKPRRSSGSGSSDLVAGNVAPLFGAPEVVQGRIAS